MTVCIAAAALLWSRTPAQRPSLGQQMGGHADALTYFKGFKSVIVGDVLITADAAELPKLPSSSSLTQVVLLPLRKAHVKCNVASEVPQSSLDDPKWLEANLPAAIVTVTFHVIRFDGKATNSDADGYCWHFTGTVTDLVIHPHTHVPGLFDQGFLSQKILGLAGSDKIEGEFDGVAEKFAQSVVTTWLEAHQ